MSLNTTGISAVAALAVAGGTLVHTTRGLADLKGEVDALRRAIDTASASAAAAESAAERSAASFKSLSQTASMAALSLVGDKDTDEAASKAAVEKLSKGVVKLETKSATHDGAIDDIYTRLDATESKIGEYLQRLSRLEGLVNGIVSGLGSSETRRAMKVKGHGISGGGISGGLPLPSGQ